MATPSAVSTRHIVLLVEDDRATRELFEYALRLAGFVVLTAGDGLGALHVLEQRRPDAVVLDLDLPQVSGADVYQEILAHADTRDVPVVVVTGTELKPPRGVFRVLHKPVTADLVSLAVVQALSDSEDVEL